MDQLIAEIQKGPLEKLVISHREYQGHAFIDIRLHFMDDDEQWHPTKKGITVSPSVWPDFLRAGGQVQTHLTPEGSTPPHRPSPRGGAKR